MADKTELHCIVTGRVQGVAYRNFTKAIADNLDLTGFVSNLPDGSVEVLAQGDFGVLKVFENHLQTGPKSARVGTIYDEWKEPEKLFSDFNIVSPGSA